MGVRGKALHSDASVYFLKSKILSSYRKLLLLPIQQSQTQWKYLLPSSPSLED